MRNKNQGMTAEVVSCIQGTWAWSVEFRDLKQEKE